MASAAFQQGQGDRSGIAGEQRRKGSARGPGQRMRPSGVIHGIAASALLASGYVACIVGIRWLLALG